MARPSRTRTAEELDAPGAHIDHAALADAGDAMTQRASGIALLEERYGMVMPYNLGAYESRIRLNIAETGQRLGEIGLMLLEIREREAAEVFADVLERVSLTPRFAQRAIQAAVKTRDLPRIQSLGSGKLLELIAEDDDDLKGLEDGGSIAGLTLDEIDTMTVRELRTTLRAERREHVEDREAHEEMLRAKDERIHKLTRDKRKRTEEDTVRAAADDLLRKADEAVVEAGSLLAQLVTIAGDINQLYAEAGMAVEADVQERLQSNAAWAQTRLSELAEVSGE